MIEPYHAGYWLVRVVRGGPETCAKIWWCWHEPGEPDNEVDQPYLQGQLGLDLVPPAKIWEIVAFAEATPAERALLVNPPAADRAPRHGRQQGLQYAPLAFWKQHRAKRISADQFEAHVRWLEWAQRNQPGHAALRYREPIDIAAMAAPRFL